ncbi:MAG TPA: aldo/keto reductase [Verrucomicrobiae bacterium]|nr:aldo/keto reductase [Verrucomicrobiae bacterium]
MKTVALGSSALVSSRLAYGCWRIAGPGESAELTPEREAAGLQAVFAAYDAGYTLFDHADMYSHGLGETIFGKALQQVSGMRDRILIGTKCGILRKGDPTPDSPYRYDSSAAHIIASCEQSLARLGVDHVDIYQLHRPDYLMDPAEVARAFSQLKSSGKAREFGVSNFHPSQVIALQKACPMLLIVNQVEISAMHLNTFHDGTLDQCLAEKITPLAWSPLAGGRLAATGPVDMHLPDHTRKLRMRETLDHIAHAREISRPVVALAWLLSHPAGIVPIVGSTNPARIAEMARAGEIELSRDEWYRIMEAGQGHRLP